MNADRNDILYQVQGFFFSIFSRSTHETIFYCLLQLSLQIPMLSIPLMHLPCYNNSWKILDIMKLNSSPLDNHIQIL